MKKKIKIKREVMKWVLDFLFLLIAGVSFVFASIFLIIGIIYEKIYQNNMKGYDKEVEGKVLEVIKSGKMVLLGIIWLLCCVSDE